MKILGKALSVLSIICYLLILGVFIVAAPMVLGYKPVVVLTGSMEPTYPVGSVIYYKSTPYAQIAVGDVITFRVTDDAKNVVTHRVFQKGAGAQTFITKGDANATPDVNPIPYSNVQGRVIGYKVPVAGHFIQYIQNYFVIGAILLILLAKIIYDRLEPEEPEKLEGLEEKEITTK